MIHQIIDLVVDTSYTLSSPHIITYTHKNKPIGLKRHMRGVYTVSCGSIDYTIHNDTDLPNPYHRWIVVNDNDPDDIIGSSTHLSNAIDQVIERFNALEDASIL